MRRSIRLPYKAGDPALHRWPQGAPADAGVHLEDEGWVVRCKTCGWESEAHPDREMASRERFRHFDLKCWEEDDVRQA